MDLFIWIIFLASFQVSTYMSQRATQIKLSGGKRAKVSQNCLPGVLFAVIVGLLSDRP